ncbi:hypothetical protein ACJMK2_028869 [Sinanodonta woodiana]|uniref:Cytochrome b5 reductase 4 n=1 Tax=Sinanodonta woodiana TaxID=1069815 RepID=A0ABD3XBZ9_SINWO
MGTPPRFITPQFPTLGSQQRVSSNSVSSQGRNKVTLKPGHSLMDWIRLTRSGKDLTGLGGKFLEVSEEELSKHNTIDDAWIALRGKVYNVTAYLDFHPGGDSELMRGAGKDATQLFDEIHQWVNAESMLEKCLVGKLKIASPISKRVLELKAGVQRSLRMNGPSSPSSPPSQPPDLPPPKPPDLQPPKFDWFQSNTSVTLVLYTNWPAMSSDFVIIDKTDLQLLITVYIQDYIYQAHIELEKDVTTSYDVRTSGSSGKVEMVFQKSQQDIQWTTLGRYLEKHNFFVNQKEFASIYRNCKVESIKEVTDDTKLFCLRFPPGTRLCVPLGYHVYITHNILGINVVRSYTVVLPSLDKESQDPRVPAGQVIHLMVKIYPGGTITPWLGSLKKGDMIHVGNFDGNFRHIELQDCSHLILYAAGTGFTPMIRLIYQSIIEDYTSNRYVQLIFFNKKEKDILWHDQLCALAEKNTRFSCTNVLSDPDDSWCGLKGRVSLQMVKDFTPKSEDCTKLLICVCGPTPFTRSVLQFAEELGYDKQQIHAFLG